MADHDNILLERILRASYGRAVGTVARLSGDLDAADDAVQHAAERAVGAWRVNVPDNPTAWLVRTARNHLIDQARRSQVHKRSIARLQPLLSEAGCDDAAFSGEDALLDLILLCCHPALAPGAQLILILRLVLGFDIPATARALLLSEDAAKKRLVRAKTKIRDAGIPFSPPADRDRSARMTVACDSLYLMFNEGFSRPIADGGINLCAEALRLTRRLASLERENRDIRCLLALMVFGAARLSARYDETGAFVPLDRQDRSKWNSALIREGLATLDSVFQRRRPPTSLQIQAAISACHSRERHASKTDWAEIAALYEHLERLDPSPVVSINRAVAVAHIGKLAEASALLGGLGGHDMVRNYQPFHSARGFVLEQLGRLAEAEAAYRNAANLTEDGPERRFLEGKAAKAAAQI